MGWRWWLALGAALSMAGAPGAMARGGGGGGGGHGGGGHGGGHTTYVVVVGGRAVEVPPFRGDETAIVLEVAPDAPTLDNIDIKMGDVVAEHTLRATDAIVLDAPAKGRRREVPAGTPLVRMAFIRRSISTTVWCDVRPTHRPLWPQEHDCFEDSNHSGRLDKLWQGDSLVHFLGFSLSGVGYYADAFATPVAYHVAKPEERPTALIGFKYCDGDGVTGPPRFALVVKTPADEDRWVLTGQCRFGVWPNPADKTHVDIDTLHLEVTPAGSGMLHVKLLGRLPPGPIGQLASTLPVRPRAQALSIQEAERARLATERRPSIMIETKAESVTYGQVHAGEMLLSAPIRHAITGTLQNRVRPGLMWRLDTPVEVGQPMFGLTGSGWGGDGIVWCAPRQKDGAWQTACFLPEGDGYLWIPHREPALLPTQAAINSLSQTGSVSSAPTVKEGPVTGFPPMTLRLMLSAIHARSASDPTLIYDVDAQVDWGEGGQSIGHRTFMLSPGGDYVNLWGITLRMQPSGSGVEVMKTIPPPPPLNIRPVDPRPPVVAEPGPPVVVRTPPAFTPPPPVNSP